MQNNCECYPNLQQQQQHQQRLLHHSQGEHRPRRSEGKNRHHYHNYPKKTDLDYEISSLIKQKEKLKQEIFKLQSMKNLNSNNMYPLIGSEDPNIQHNILSNVYTKLYSQEQKIRYMQIYCQTQQKEHERIIQGW